MKGTRRSVADFGIPTWLAGSLGVLLPFGEIVTAVLLLPATSFWFGGLGALVLAVVFTVSISINLLRGRKPDCHCFGQLYAKPIGWPTLVRATILAAIAGFLVAFGRSWPVLSVVTLVHHLTTAETVGLIATSIVLFLVVAQAALVIHLLRQHGRLLLRLEALERKRSVGAEPPSGGLPIGSPAPEFQLTLVDGGEMTLNALRREGKLVVLLFSDPNCGPCSALYPEVARWQYEHAEKLTLVLVSRGDAEINRDHVNKHGLQHLLLQKDREVSERYLAFGTPSAVLVQPDGTIGSNVAAGSQAISELLARVTGAATPVISRPAANNHFFDMVSQA